MNFRPLQNYVLVERDEDKQVSSIISMIKQEKADRGTVIAVGPGKRNPKGELVPTVVQAGDRVVFQKYGGQIVKVEGQEFFLVREEEIFAVLTTIVKRFDKAIASNKDLPILNPQEWEELQKEAKHMSEFDRDEALLCCRYHGRGFGVDLSSTVRV